MKAVGITCGIGSMLVGARAAGFEVVGNVEWRRYYHATDELGRNTFLANFPGATFPEKLEGLELDEIEKLMGADIALGHPECGNFSPLSAPNLKMGHDHRNDAADIPLFVELVAKLRPRFFVMDDLPGSLVPFPMSEYHARLPEYDLFPEWISNWGYGNVQKGRRRFFMIGALRSEGWAFTPGEDPEFSATVAEVLGDLPLHPAPRGNWPNHDPHHDEARSTLFISDGRGGRRHSTWGEVAEIVAAMPEGKTIPYVAADLTEKLKIGFFRPRWDGHSYVLTGGPNSSLHPVRCNPYSIRERARIQGFPDDFVFYGTKLEEDGRWNILRNVHMVKQTGKAMPVQFCTYVSRQIAAHVRGEEFSSSGIRTLAPRREVDAAKQWYCENVGYADQERACGACWLYKSCLIRQRKYQVGEPVVGQTDAFQPGVVPAPGPVKKKPEPARTVREIIRDRPRPACREVEEKVLTFGGDSGSSS